MQRYLNKIKDKEILIIALSTAIFLLRTNIPYAIFIFSLLQFSLLISILKNNSFKDLSNNVKLSFKAYLSYYLIIIFFLIGLVLSPYTIQARGDIINLLMTISFIVLFYIKLNTIKKFYLFRDYFVISFTILFSLYLLIRFVFLLYNNEIANYLFLVNNKEGFDRNSYSLNLWISVITAFWTIKNIVQKKWIFLGNIYIFLLLTLVLFSSSRRGVILLGIFFTGFIFWQIYLLVINRKIINKYIWLFRFIVLSFIGIISLIFINPNTRNSLFISTINDNGIKSEITQTIRRYYILEYPNTTHEQFEKILWGEEKIDLSKLLFNSKREKNTFFIDLIRDSWNKTDNKDSLFSFLPEISDEQIAKINDENIKYLPELLRFPYNYSGIFSCKSINNLELLNFSKEGISNDFTFLFKKDKAFINIKLPALSNSVYRLKFYVDSPIIDSLFFNNSTNIKELRSVSKVNNKYYYQIEYEISNNISNIIQVHLNLTNKVDSFLMSDIQYSLISSNNKTNIDSINSILSIAFKNKRVDHMNREYPWSSFLKAEKAVSILGYSYRNSKIIKKYIDSIYLGVIPRIYSGTTVINNIIDTVLFNSNIESPRFSYKIPIIQNNYLDVNIDYSLFDTLNTNLFAYCKRFPEVINVVHRNHIIFDSINNYGDYSYKRKIRLFIDTTNSAEALLILGLKNINTNKYITINDYSINQIIEQDSIMLTNTQFNRLKEWSINTTKSLASKKRLDSIRSVITQYDVLPYWEIPSFIYQYPSSDRLELWLFGWQYYKWLPWQKQLFGDGFNYYKIYKIKFGGFYHYTKQYFPHNPILSSLLYSGIIGAIAYIFFLLQVFYYYFKYRKDYGILLIIFILVFLYSFVSNRSHFTDTFFIIFTLFPFILHNIYSSKRMAEVGE